MKTDISFCPVCAGKLDAGDDEQFKCEDCEMKFFIQLVEGDDEEDEDEDDDEDDEEEEKDEEDEY